MTSQSVPDAPQDAADRALYGRDSASTNALNLSGSVLGLRENACVRPLLVSRNMPQDARPGPAPKTQLSEHQAR